MCFLVIFAFMRLLMFFILLLAFGCQRTTVNGQQTPCTVPEPVEGTASGASTSSATAYPRTVDCCPLSVDYYEKQIHIADSLYKNYLPQHNFEEVKAAVEFFDSLRLTTDNSQQTTDFVHRIFPNKRQRTMCTVPEPVEGTALGASTSSATAYPRTVDCCPLTVDIDFIYAKAHYYHAVGLTEKDDIVGACEHYLIALEIMEDLMAKDKSLRKKDKRLKAKGKEKAHSSKFIAHSSEYEKTRFLALIYNRLGRLFLNENYCNLAILKYKKALKYIDLIDEPSFKANVLKELGNSYQLYNQPDSALYYYDKSIETNPNTINKLDVEKSIAQILYNKGEKDSAYMLIKNNLDKIANYAQKDSYYMILGEMYYKDKEYDSAIYYLNISCNSNNYSIKTTSFGMLSMMYDSLGNHDEKAYCDDVVSAMLLKNSNKAVLGTQLQNVYDNYKEGIFEKERLENRKQAIIIISALAILVVFTLAVILLLWIINQKKSGTITDKENYICKIIEDIKHKDSEIETLKENVNEKEITISALSEQMATANKADINAYFETEICKNILMQIKYKNANAKKITLNKLKPKEMIALKYAANSMLNGFLNRIGSEYYKIDNEDTICICLLLLDVSITDISELLGKSYNTIWTRIVKMKGIFNLDSDSNIQSFLLNLV